MPTEKDDGLVFCSLARRLPPSRQSYLCALGDLRSAVDDQAERVRAACRTTKEDVAFINSIWA
eukprot:scaffold140982_cov36-Tisochrysis_lutea.AAC.1